MSDINVQRRRFLKTSVGLAAVAVAPGMLLFEVAHGKPDAVSNKVRWGMLIDTANCVDGCNDCVTACNRENGLSGGVSPTDSQWMRKNHMHLLKHQRDETVRKGIRDEKFSLKNCIECHASARDDSVIAREDSFCVACHRYEAVNIDCFECHSGIRKSAWLQRNRK